MLQCISKEKWRIKSDRVKLVSVHKSFVVPSEGLKCLNQTELEPSSTGHMFRIWPKLLLYIHRESCRSLPQTSSRKLHSWHISVCQYSHIFLHYFQVEWYVCKYLCLECKWGVEPCLAFVECFWECTASGFCALFQQVWRGGRIGGSVDVGYDAVPLV